LLAERLYKEKDSIYIQISDCDMLVGKYNIFRVSTSSPLPQNAAKSSKPSPVVTVESTSNATHVDCFNAFCAAATFVDIVRTAVRTPDIINMI
jgi:hypothetical protein